jgi:hypothetical protein
MMSPSHRAALRFLRGGLVAVVALLVPSQFGFISRESPALAALVTILRIVVPAAGFAAGGAVGGAALGRGARGVWASSAALLVTGLVVTAVAPHVQGLTGFENPAVVMAFAASATGGAFALGGAVLAALLDARHLPRITAGFLAGGAAGGVVTVLPSVLAASLAGWPADAQLFLRLACSLAGLLGPFAVAGAVAGGALQGDDQ